jgi:hypothetical protein
MIYAIKHSFEYKLIGIILYFFVSLAGISIILLYSPKYLLFNEQSKEEKIKLNLYKDFSKNIYENINTPLIKNLTLTEDGKDCPKNFELLKIKNQYNGHFVKFYGNKSICIERIKDDSYTFKNLLQKIKFDENKNKHKCSELFKNSSQYLYVSNEMNCPLNYIEINTKSKAQSLGNHYFKMGPGDQYLSPIYGKDSKYPIITNIEITNNNKVCLEKDNNINDLPCEFPDNNECLIEDNFEQIYTIGNNQENILFPENLAKWNLVKDQNIKHNFCKNDLKFHIFAQGYAKFTDRNLQEFEEEFPPLDYTNNPLYKTYKAFKSPRNIDNFFCLISYNLFIWSSIHFAFQIMLYLNKKDIRIIYLNNGIILFFCKLLALIGMIINYFCFYLKIEKVYLVMVDQPRNKIIEYYKYSREFLIVKIVFICLIGFLIICIEYIIFLLNYIFDLEDKSLYKISIVSDSPPAILENPYKQKKQTKEIEIPISKNELRSRGRNIIGRDTYSDFLYSNEITLKFIFKSDINKSYLIKVEKDKSFNEALTKLKSDYSELKEKNMKIFITCDSIVINKNKTIKDNQISSYNNTIYIQ